MSSSSPTAVTTDVTTAANALLRGELVAFPTETVWGLGAIATHREGIAKIYAAKGRPSDNPLIVHVSDLAGALALFCEWPSRPLAESLLRAFAPGPITVVIPRPASLPPEVSAGLPTVGLRIPSHEVARALLHAVAAPVAAPSANVSGRPSPTTRAGVLASLDGKIPWVLDGPRGEIGLESTVVDCTGDTPILLRAGAISVESLREVTPTLTRLADEEARARSPGTRHRHYAPRCAVRLTRAPRRKLPPNARYEATAYIGLSTPQSDEPFLLQRVCTSVEDYARELFEFMREVDSLGAEYLLCEIVAEEGIGLALMDRVRRAAGDTER